MRNVAVIVEKYFFIYLIKSKIGKAQFIGAHFIIFRNAGTTHPLAINVIVDSDVKIVT